MLVADYFEVHKDRKVFNNPIEMSRMTKDEFLIRLCANSQVRSAQRPAFS